MTNPLKFLYRVHFRPELSPDTYVSLKGNMRSYKHSHIDSLVPGSRDNTSNKSQRFFLPLLPSPCPSSSRQPLLPRSTLLASSSSDRTHLRRHADFHLGTGGSETPSSSCLPTLRSPLPSTKIIFARPQPPAPTPPSPKIPYGLTANLMKSNRAVVSRLASVK